MGWGLPLEGVVVEKFLPSLGSLFSLSFEGGTWHVPGILPGYPGTVGVFKKFVQIKFVFIFCPSSCCGAETPTKFIGEVQESLSLTPGPEGSAVSVTGKAGPGQGVELLAGRQNLVMIALLNPESPTLLLMQVSVLMLYGANSF